MMWENKSSVSGNYTKELSGKREMDMLPGSHESLLVDLNLLFTKSWKRINRLGRFKISARLDTLPFAEGDIHDWQFVIANLLSMIMQHPPKGSFFLHIQCNSNNHIKPKKGFSQYRIDIKTNVTASEYWHQLYDEKLKEIEKAVNKLKCIFSYDCSLQNGCLFTIILPGKQKT